MTEYPIRQESRVYRAEALARAATMALKNNDGHASDRPSVNVTVPNAVDGSVK